MCTDTNMVVNELRDRLPANPQPLAWPNRGPASTLEELNELVSTVELVSLVYIALKELVKRSNTISNEIYRMMQSIALLTRIFNVSVECRVVTNHFLFAQER